MSQPPEGPEYYAPPPQAPVNIPPPPSISEAAAQYGVVQASDGTYQYAQNPAYNTPRPSGSGQTHGLAIAALVLGIIAFVTGWIPVWGIVLGLLAATFGFVALGKKQSKGMSITGIVTGLLGAILSGVVLVVLIAGAGWLADPDNWASIDPGYSYDPDTEYYYGDSTTLGPDAGDSSLAIVEQEFGQSETNPDVWWYVVIVDNPNDTPFPNSDVTVRALAADGTQIEESWTYRGVAPGRTALVGNFWNVGSATIASVEVLGPPAEAVSSKAAQGGLDVSELTVENTDWSTTVSGTVTSRFDELKYGAVVAIVARDASGAIIGGANGYVGELEAGSTESFDAFFYDGPLEGATFEAFAWPY